VERLLHAAGSNRSRRQQGLARSNSADASDTPADTVQSGVALLLRVFEPALKRSASDMSSSTSSLGRASSCGPAILSRSSGDSAATAATPLAASAPTAVSVDAAGASACASATQAHVQDGEVSPATCLLLASLTCHINLPHHTPGQRAPHLTLLQLMQLTLQLLACVCGALQQGTIQAAALTSALAACVHGLQSALAQLAAVEGIIKEAAAYCSDAEQCQAVVSPRCASPLLGAAAALISVCERLKPARQWYVAEATRIADQGVTPAYVSDATRSLVHGVAALAGNEVGAEVRANLDALRAALATLQDAYRYAQTKAQQEGGAAW